MCLTRIALTTLCNPFPVFTRTYKDEGISLGPIVQQLDTPQIEEKTVEAVVRVPVWSAVNRRSSIARSRRSSVQSTVHSAVSLRSKSSVLASRRTSLESDRVSLKAGEFNFIVDVFVFLITGCSMLITSVFPF